MAWMLSYPLITLTYLSLFLSVLLLWYPRTKGEFQAWGIALGLALLLGLWAKQLGWSAPISTLVLGVAVYYSQVKKTNPGIQLLATFGVLFIVLAICIHQMPGFDGLMVLDHVQFTADAMPYTLYLNFDKALIGIFILGLGFPLVTSPKQLTRALSQAVRPAAVTILFVMILALVTGFVRFEFKLPSAIFIWALSNLLFTCVAEEALFRGFIQRKLVVVFNRMEGGVYLALILASVIFGLAHYPGGIKYMILATMAGLGYGWVYQITGRIEASIAMHFSLNLIQFIFFTYPVLASAV